MIILISLLAAVQFAFCVPAPREQHFFTESDESAEYSPDGVLPFDGIDRDGRFGSTVVSKVASFLSAKENDSMGVRDVRPSSMSIREVNGAGAAETLDTDEMDVDDQAEPDDILEEEKPALEQLAKPDPNAESGSESKEYSGSTTAPPQNNDGTKANKTKISEEKKKPLVDSVAPDVGAPDSDQDGKAKELKEQKVDRSNKSETKFEGSKSEADKKRNTAEPEQKPKPATVGSPNDSETKSREADKKSIPTEPEQKPKPATVGSPNDSETKPRDPKSEADKKSIPTEPEQKTKPETVGRSNDSKTKPRVPKSEADKQTTPNEDNGEKADSKSNPVNSTDPANTELLDEGNEKANGTQAEPENKAEPKNDDPEQKKTPDSGDKTPAVGRPQPPKQPETRKTVPTNIPDTANPPSPKPTLPLQSRPNPVPATPPTPPRRTPPRPVVPPRQRNPAERQAPPTPARQPATEPAPDQLYPLPTISFRNKRFPFEIPPDFMATINALTDAMSQFDCTDMVLAPLQRLLMFMSHGLHLFPLPPMEACPLLNRRPNRRELRNSQSATWPRMDRQRYRRPWRAVNFSNTDEGGIGD